MMKMVMKTAAMPLVFVLLIAEIIAKVIWHIVENAGSVLIGLVGICILIACSLGQNYNVIAGVAIEMVLFFFMVLGTLAIEIIRTFRESIMNIF